MIDVCIKHFENGTHTIYKISEQSLGMVRDIDYEELKCRTEELINVIHVYEEKGASMLTHIAELTDVGKDANGIWYVAFVPVE